MKSFIKSFEQEAKLKKALENHKRGDFISAKNAYEALLRDDPERSDILYNLALALISLDDIPSAQHFLEKTLEKIPSHFDALNNLGALLLKQNQHEQALHCFSAVISGNPDHIEGRNNLAAVLLQLGKYYHASEHYRLLLQKIPEDLGVQYSYGLSLLELGELNPAVLIFEKILRQNPFHLNAQSNLGIAYFKLGDIPKSREIFKTVLAQNPDIPEIQYLYAAISNENIPDKPPKEYIQNLFDHYACYYEQHLIDKLQYDVPQQLFKLLKQYFDDQGLILPEKTWKILDLGCGTGLSGLVFQKLAQNLTGVDLSEKMLAVAKNKAIYQALIQADLLDYLTHANSNNSNSQKIPYEAYDLIIASDTFNYFGNLEPVFNACYQHLTFKTPNDQNNTHKFLLFSFENAQDHAQDAQKQENLSDFQLKPHGRYCHEASYIEKLAKKHHFKIQIIQASCLRQQNHSPVQGFLCLMSL